MKTDAIICITVAKSGTTLDQELALCSKLLKDKYSTKTKVFVQVETGAQQLKDRSQGNPVLEPVKKQLGELTKIASAWEKDRSTGGVGLYFQTHGSPTGGLSPPAAELAELVASFYTAWGLRFRKVNLSACFSAGQSSAPWDDVSQSALAEFCRALGKRLSGREDWLKGLMVAAYRAFVTFVEKGGVVRNNLDYSFRDAPTHPQGEVPKSVAALAEKAVKLGQKKAKQAYDQKTNERNKEDGKRTPDAVYLIRAADYVVQKLVLKFDGKKWDRVSLAEYSDNGQIAAMIKVIDRLVGLVDEKEYKRLAVVI